MELRRVDDLKGRVLSGDYGEGTKSARPGVFLETMDGKEQFLLRRKGGPAFGDTEVSRLVGKVVVCSGYFVGETLLAENILVVE